MWQPHTREGDPLGTALAQTLAIQLNLEDAPAPALLFPHLMTPRMLRHFSIKRLTPANKRNATLLLNVEQVTRHHSYLKGSVEPPNF